MGSAGTFKKRTIVIATNEQYVQHIPIDFVQDKCDILDGYKVGQEVKVSINIRGNEYNGKFYVSLNGWRIEKVEGIETADLPRAEEVFEGSVLNAADADDLPFWSNKGLKELIETFDLITPL